MFPALVSSGLLNRAVPLLVSLLSALPPATLAMGSPWWENYDLKERFLCSDRAAIVVERNASQASLIAGGYRSTLFREASDAPGLRYRSDDMLLILRGDELILEQLPRKLTCVRTEDV